MAKGNNTNSSKPAQATVTLRLIAGAYLLYLAYGLFQEYLKPEAGGKFIQIGAAILFSVAGGIIAGWSLLKFVKGDYIKHGQLPDEEEGEQQIPDSQEGEETQPDDEKNH